MYTIQIRAGIEFQSGCPWGVWCQKQHEGSKGPCRSLVEGCRGRTVPHWKKLKSYYTKRHFPSFFNHFLVHTCPQYMYFSISMYIFLSSLFLFFQFCLFLFFSFSLFSFRWFLLYSLFSSTNHFLWSSFTPCTLSSTSVWHFKGETIQQQTQQRNSSSVDDFKINEDVTYAPF